MKHCVFIYLLSIWILSSCGIGDERVKGNGNIRTEERTVSSFDEIEVHGALEVFLTQGDFKPVRIEGDENLISYIEIVEQGDKITLQTRDGYDLDFNNDMKVYITAPQFRYLDVSGASKLVGQTLIDNNRNLSLDVSGAAEINLNIDAPEIKSEISGSGTLHLKGETKEYRVDISGAGTAHCYDLLSENTFVDISGAGNAEVYASVKLDAQVSGAGTVRYKGKAKNIKQDVSGAGSVKGVD